MNDIHEMDIEYNISIKTIAFLLELKIEKFEESYSPSKFIEQKGLAEEFRNFVKEKNEERAKELIESYTKEERQWIRENPEKFKKMFVGKKNEK